MTSIEAAKPSQKSAFWENVQTVLLALVLAMGIRFAVAQPFRIPSGSMQPTLLVGDYILVTKWSYGYSRFSIEPLNFGFPHGRLLGHEPKRGDVIVFRPPPDESKDFVKRLVGLPGDTIQVRNSELYINGVVTPRQYIGMTPFKDEHGDVDEIAEYRETMPNGVSYITFDRTLNGPLDNTGVYRVPAGHYFFMGDDRDNSADSRVPSVVGYVPAENLVGHAQFVVVSWDPTETSLFAPWTWITGVRKDRFFKGVP
jgi:signal peptidase I